MQTATQNHVADWDAWNRIMSVRGQIFRVTFRTKNPKFATGTDGIRRMIRPAGAIRNMVCRRGVHKYTLGVIPPHVRLAEDVDCNVLTVWDLQVFNALRTFYEDQGLSEGLAQFRAGRESYRRINMADVLDISIAP